MLKIVCVSGHQQQQRGSSATREFDDREEEAQPGVSVSEQISSGRRPVIHVSAQCSQEQHDNEEQQHVRWRPGEHEQIQAEQTVQQQLLRPLHWLSQQSHVPQLTLKVR